MSPLDPRGAVRNPLAFLPFPRSYPPSIILTILIFPPRSSQLPYGGLDIFVLLRDTCAHTLVRRRVNTSPTSDLVEHVADALVRPLSVVFMAFQLTVSIGRASRITHRKRV